ncbi:MAG: translesion error-prone DNA polymerase V autoproteolytic subunit [Rikenellaceae bacterium]
MNFDPFVAMKPCEIVNIFTPEMSSPGGQPMAQSAISAGFPSPAEGLISNKLDLNRELVKNPASTFYARVSGYSMRDEGISDGDLLVIDKSVEPYDGCLAVAYIDGDFTLKRFADHGEYGLLVPANEEFEPIRVTADNDFMIWGVVRYVIKKV